jgi:ABC-type dipeptide/oligopeptide/nickel transport system permease subunit
MTARDGAPLALELPAPSLPWTRSFGPVVRAFTESKVAAVAAIIVVIAVIYGVFGSQLATADPEAPSRLLLRAPSWAHLFGTDNLGRDVYSRIAIGARTSMSVTTLSTLFAVLIGVPIGVVAGYTGGWLDLCLMRLIDALYSIPSIVLAMAMLVLLGNGITNVAFAIALVFVPIFSRVVRSSTLVVRELEYVLAARAQGAGSLRILLRHIWPNVRAPAIVQASLVLGFAILLEASLSYLGFGVSPSTPTWGRMTRDGYSYLSRAGWMALAPGMTIFLVVLSFNLLGDALRDAFDPRSRRR